MKVKELEFKKLNKPAVMKSVCSHTNQERIYWGTNRCKDCGRFILRVIAS